MAAPKAPSEIVIDPAGDRFLLAGVEGENQVRIRVSSKAMSLACKPWQAMLDPAKAFSEQSRPAEDLRFPEDDPDAMVTVLRIVHLLFDDVPSCVLFGDLARLATLCDKFDLVHIVQPFLDRWLSIYKDMLFTPGYERWLTISWGFKHKDEFETLLTHIVRNVRSDSAGRLLNTQRDTIQDGGLPVMLADSVRNARKEVLMNLVNAAYKRVAYLLQDDVKCGESYNPRDSRACRSNLLWYHLKTLQENSFYPRPDSCSQTECSAEEFATALKSSWPQPAIRGCTILCGKHKQFVEEINLLLANVLKTPALAAFKMTTSKRKAG